MGISQSRSISTSTLRHHSIKKITVSGSFYGTFFYICYFYNCKTCTQVISLITATKSISKKTSKILAKCLVKFIFVVLVFINSKSRDDFAFQFFLLFVPPIVLSYLIFAQVSHSSLSKKHYCTNVQLATTRVFCFCFRVYVPLLLRVGALQLIQLHEFYPKIKKNKKKKLCTFH